jgi:hypothetical protein
MRALETEVVDAVWARSSRCFRHHQVTDIRSVATGPESRIGCASRES